MGKPSNLEQLKNKSAEFSIAETSERKPKQWIFLYDSNSSVFI